MSINFGYARVSTSEQTADRQITELLKYVTDERYIYVDNASGTTSDRPDLYALKRAIRKGDHLYIHELDRLGRTKEVIKGVPSAYEEFVSIRNRFKNFAVILYI